MATVPQRMVETGAVEKLEDVYEVILYNDDHNEAFYVVDCLVKVFAHPVGLAVKIMLEAHNTGRAIAQVEGLSEARLHRDQLVSAGLTADIEKV